MSELNNKSDEKKKPFEIKVLRRYKAPKLTLKSPSLFVYRPTLDSLCSILIRILGFYFFFLILFLTFILGSNNILLEHFFFSLYENVFVDISLFFLRVFIKLVILENATFLYPFLIFTSFIFFLNHIHLGYRHSFVRSKFKINEDLSYPFQSLLEEDLEF